MIVHDVSKKESKSFSKQRIQVFQPTQLLSISKVAAMVTGLSVTWAIRQRDVLLECRLKSRGGDIWRGVIDVVQICMICHYVTTIKRCWVQKSDQMNQKGPVGCSHFSLHAMQLVRFWVMDFDMLMCFSRLSEDSLSHTRTNTGHVYQRWHLVVPDWRVLCPQLWSQRSGTLKMDFPRDVILN